MYSKRYQTIELTENEYITLIKKIEQLEKLVLKNLD
jgi:hypothetical protein